MSVDPTGHGDSVSSDESVEIPSRRDKDSIAALLIAIGIITAYVASGLEWGFKIASVCLGLSLVVLGCLLAASSSSRDHETGSDEA